MLNEVRACRGKRPIGPEELGACLTGVIDPIIYGLEFWERLDEKIKAHPERDEIREPLERIRELIEELEKQAKEWDIIGALEDLTGRYAVEYGVRFKPTEEEREETPLLPLIECPRSYGLPGGRAKIACSLPEPRQAPYRGPVAIPPYFSALRPV